MEEYAISKNNENKKAKKTPFLPGNLQTFVQFPCKLV